MSDMVTNPDTLEGGTPLGQTPQSVIPDTDSTDPYSSDQVGYNTDEKPEKKEYTRSKMAILFVLGFFSILFLCFVYAIKVNATLSELKDTLIGVIGALSGTLGFIVGYYYKSTLEQ